MDFNIDKQTLDELNLLGKFKQGSIYGLFNKVKTSGGERLLNEMFNRPLTEEEAINNRSRVFQYFQQERLIFPFDIQQIEAMRDFMDTSFSGNRFLGSGNIVIKKILSGLTHDERYRKEVQGLQAAINILHTLKAFIQSMRRPDNVFDLRVTAIKAVLNDPRINVLLNINIYQSLTLKTLAYNLHLLKHSLRPQMDDVLQFIYETDVYMTISNVADTHHMTYAEALPAEKNILQAENLSHPAITNAVGNSLSLKASQNVLFLTGANMAGKSTLMKSIGINIYLGHIGFPVSASNMTFSVLEGLYSSINVADNINLGYSHFYAEVVRVKQAAEAAAAGKRLLLMFDELFKGTNVKDAFDGTLAVTESFSEYRKCLFVVSTHIIEVAAALKNNHNIRFVYMPTIMNGRKPTYTYLLEEGITEDRQGMLIIQNEGILEMLETNTVKN